MADNNINKVIYGDDVLIDLTEDTVQSNNLKRGYTAHNASGEVIVGEYDGFDINGIEKTCTVKGSNISKGDFVNVYNEYQPYECIEKIQGFPNGNVVNIDKIDDDLYLVTDASARSYIVSLSQGKCIALMPQEDDTFENNKYSYYGCSYMGNYEFVHVNTYSVDMESDTSYFNVMARIYVTKYDKITNTFERKVVDDLVAVGSLLKSKYKNDYYMRSGIYAGISKFKYNTFFINGKVFVYDSNTYNPLQYTFGVKLGKNTDGSYYIVSSHRVYDSLPNADFLFRTVIADDGFAYSFMPYRVKDSSEVGFSGKTLVCKINISTWRYSSTTYGNLIVPSENIVDGHMYGVNYYYYNGNGSCYFNYWKDSYFNYLFPDVKWGTTVDRIVPFSMGENLPIGCIGINSNNVIYKSYVTYDGSTYNYKTSTEFYSATVFLSATAMDGEDGSNRYISAEWGSPDVSYPNGLFFRFWDIKDPSEDSRVLVPQSEERNICKKTTNYKYIRGVAYEDGLVGESIKCIVSEYDLMDRTSTNLIAETTKFYVDEDDGHLYVEIDDNSNLEYGISEGRLYVKESESN